ncbi:alpha/beta hydrolase [Paraburkholderia sp. LEh10]|uniref:alpha/beta hydrolase n=1 Tax=Paraburkholderia sp. LEh10 TaxID=2821353 RepID=UPI001AE7A76C|nr:alpha/beta fold hydrolase [Paraburkholderia sp. LEh10]MBP0592216.1 alpha/beta hydrolase [Paraburkholderia sp. LEh10]
MSLLAFCIRITLAAYVIALVALYFMQDRMLLPSALHMRAPPTGHHAGFDVAPWQANGHYAGYVVTPAARMPRGTFIVFHGNAETAENKLPVAEVFMRAGYRVVMAEYPGQGNRPGERTMKAALSASREALDAACAQWGAPVWLVGESLGAGMAAQIVRGNESKVAGAVLITPWDSLASVAAGKLPLFPVRWMLHDPFDSIAALARYRGPLVVIGAQQDALIPVAHAQRLASARAGTHLMLLPDANHDTWFDAMTTGRWQQVLDWLVANQPG